MKKRIFFFEDERGLVYYFTQELMEEYDVTHHRSVAKISVNEVIKQNFDLFLLDIRGEMGDEEGLEFAKRLRAAGCTKPIVFSSVKTIFPSVSKEIRAVGNSDALIRPHPIETLRKKIKGILGE